MKAGAIVLVALICGQAVTAHINPLGKALVASALAKEAVDAVGGALLNAGLEVNRTAAEPIGYVPENFTVGESFGNLYCFPRQQAGQFQPPTLICPDGYDANTTVLNSIVCVKKGYVTTQGCFRSMQCPADSQNYYSEQLCMPKEARSALVGMLVVFKVHAILPFMLLPALKIALLKAITFPVTLPVKLLAGGAVLDALGGGLFDKFSRNASEPLLLQLLKDKVAGNFTEPQTPHLLGDGKFSGNFTEPQLMQQLLNSKVAELQLLEQLIGSKLAGNISEPQLLQLLASSKVNAAQQLLNFTAPKVPSSIQILPELTITLGNANFTKPEPLTVLRQMATLATAGGQEVLNAFTAGMLPEELVAKSLLNMNITEVLNLTPQINAWISEHLQNVTNVNEITAKISSVFPDCLYKCCRTDTQLQTLKAVPTPVCAPGYTLSPILKVCVSSAALSVQCPGNMTSCAAPKGQQLCVAETNSFGLDTCKLLGAAIHTLPKHLCP